MIILVEEIDLFNLNYSTPTLSPFFFQLLLLDSNSDWDLARKQKGLGGNLAGRAFYLQHGDVNTG